MAQNTLTTILNINASAFNSGLAAARGNVTQFAQHTRSMNTSLNKMALSITAWGAGLVSAGAIIQDTIEKNMKFEKSLSSLRALTGVTANELSFFKDEATKLGSTTQQSASQVVEAFKMIGSQAPELLSSKEALAEVTKNAIILSEAADIELTDAAKGVTTIMNQMNVSGMDSAKIINILAAASQAGAGDVTYLNTALEKSASVAASFGLSIEDVVALIETLAPRMSDAASAGTNLRNILIKLETQSNDKFKPSIVGVSQALNNLSDANMTAAEQAKLFGLENITSAKALIDNTKEVDNYRTAITNTSTAYEQQRINTDNLSGSVASLSSAWEGLQLSISNSNGLLRDGIELANMFVQGLSALMGKRIGYESPFSVQSEYEQIKADVDAQTAAYIQMGMTKEQAAQKAYDYIKALNDKELEDLRKLQTQKDEKHNAYLNSKGSGNRIENITKKEWEALPDNTERISAKQSAMSLYAQDFQKKNSEKKSTAPSTTGETTTKKKGKVKVSVYVDGAEDEYDMSNVDAVWEGVQSNREEKHNNSASQSLLKSDSFSAINQPFEITEPKKLDLSQQIEQYSMMGSSITNMTSALNAGGNSWVTYGTNIISAVAAAIPAIMTLVAAREVETQANTTAAASGAAASVASIPVVGWVMAGAAVASVIAAIASVPKFATGGIVGGSSFNGDKVPALLNSGEIVLNQRQQSNLFQQLNRPAGNDNSMGGNVVFSIKGDQLVGMLEKVNKRKSRV